MDSKMLLPFLLSLFAGLATLIGFAITFIARRTNRKLLSYALGLSAGVMIFVAFVEIFTEARSILTADKGPRQGLLMTVIFFFGGMGLIALIDRFVPSFGNPHEPHSVEEMAKKGHAKPKLMKMGVMAAVAIAIHNFPEGIATFIAAFENPALGISIATAVAIHNIPEGIAVSIPIFYATGSHTNLPHPDAFPFPCCHGGRLCSGSGHHGIHILGRAPAWRPRIRGTPHCHLRTHLRHGHHGHQPDPVRIGASRSFSPAY